MLTEQEAAELAALRARAYGPDADLHHDPAGLARLAQLEAAAHGTAETLPEEDRDAGIPATATGSDSVPEGSAAPSSSGGSPASGLAFEDAPDAGGPPPAGLTVGPSDRRPRWPRAIVLLTGIPALAIACGIGLAVGAAAGTPSAPESPSPLFSEPDTTLSSQYVASWNSVRHKYSWDAGSPRLIADIQDVYVWSGTTGSGKMTCIAVDDHGTIPTACQQTESLTADGVGIGVVDPITGDYREFVVWPNGVPVVRYIVISKETGQAITGAYVPPTASGPSPPPEMVAAG